MRLLAILLLTIAGWLGSTAAEAAADPRLALVIANGAYRSFDRLTGPYHDGDKIAAALSATGFVDAAGSGPVAVRRDLDAAGMQGAIAAFRAALAAAGPKAFGMLYFSGHGAALGSFGDVMLVPVDAGQDVSSQAGAFSRAALTRNLLGSGAKTVMIVLDMCRNVVPAPPAPAAETAQPVTADTQPGSKGLARVVHSPGLTLRSDQGYLVAFSTSPDQVAFDDGTFSKVLAEEIRRPRQNVADALKRVSDRVAITPGKAFQKPTFDYGLQGTPPCFVTCDANAGGGRFLDCANCPYMRVVPSGSFLYGSPANEPQRGRDEPIQADTKIEKPFALGVYEVTVAEWAACVRDKACHPIADWSKENPNPLIPATGVSYEDAQAYVAWLSVQTGRAYRIPSEQEWEYADRAGVGSAFPWGDTIAPSDANYDQTASYLKSPTAPYRGYPEAINAYPPNGFGLYQMQGNVWEWSGGCGDKACASHVLRGGSFESIPAALRSANRFAVASGKRRDDAGLRVARDLGADENTE